MSLYSSDTDVTVSMTNKSLSRIVLSIDWSSASSYAIAIKSALACFFPGWCSMVLSNSASISFHLTILSSILGLLKMYLKAFLINHYSESSIQQIMSKFLKQNDHCQVFSFCHRVIILCLYYLSTSISNCIIMLFIIILTKYSSYINIWCIRIKKKRLIPIRFCQNWRRHQSLPKYLKCHLCFFIFKDEFVLHSLLHVVCQSISFVGKALDEPSIVPHHIKELPQIGQSHPKR